MRVSHPECDLRPWLAAHGAWITPYTTARIRASYETIPRLLAACPDLRGTSACDVGCGSGFDAFALGMFFDRVVAIDSDPSAVAEAERIGRDAGVSNIRFVQARAEQWEAPQRFELVFCNLMSHNLSSRLALVRRVADLLQPHGIFLYAEIAEGYAPLEIHRAVRRKDAAEVGLRCRQVVNGFARRTGFRFFLSGTIGPLMDACGFRVVEQEAPRWNGLPYLVRVVGMRAHEPRAARFPDPDYVEVRGEFAEAAEHFRHGIDRRWGRLAPRRRQALLDIATQSPNPYAPYLLYLLMADALFPAAGFRGAMGERLCRWLAGPPGPRGGEAGWEALEQIDRQFLELARRRTGLDGPWDD
jgi:SAM-dependent methyltransferase